MKTWTVSAARRRAGLTQVELAARCGVHQVTISKLEVGKIANPSFRLVLNIARAVKVDPRALKFGVARHPESGAAA